MHRIRTIIAIMRWAGQICQQSHILRIAVVSGFVVLNINITGLAQAATLRNHWTFDSDFTDAVGGLHGTAKFDARIVQYWMSNGAKFGGGALLLDGNDAVDIGNDLLPDTDFTWSAWILTENMMQASGYIMANQESANFGAVMRVALNQFFLRINNYSGTTDYTATIGSYSSNTWTHVCLSIDSSTGMNFHVNGILIDSNVAVVKYQNNTTVSVRNFAIGSAFDASGLNGFDGLIDDVAIFNGVLDAAQLANVIKYGAANFDRPPDPAGTVLIVR